MTNVPNLLKDYLTAPQAAQALTVSVGTLKRWRANRQGPQPSWIGGRLFYHQEDLGKWVDAERARSDFSGPR